MGNKSPESWITTSLGKLVAIWSGKSPTLFSFVENGKYPYIKVDDLNNCEKYQIRSRFYTNDENFWWK